MVSHVTFISIAYYLLYLSNPQPNDWSTTHAHNHSGGWSAYQERLDHGVPGTILPIAWLHQIQLHTLRHRQAMTYSSFIKTPALSFFAHSCSTLHLSSTLTNKNEKKPQKPVIRSSKSLLQQSKKRKGRLFILECYALSALLAWVFGDKKKTSPG